MTERGFTDGEFRMTGDELTCLSLCVSMLAGVAAVLILEIAVEPLLGPPEGWTGARAAASNLLFILATSCLAFFLGKLLLERWIEKRIVPSQGGGASPAASEEGVRGHEPIEVAPNSTRIMADDVVGQERPGRVVFEATEVFSLDLTTGEARRQAAGKRPPEDGDAASGVPAGTRR